MSYPAPPWRLQGEACAAFWRVPLGELPVGSPAGARPVALAGGALVCTAWARYGRGSVLEYEELLCAQAVRAGGRLAAHVTHIWVDEPASALGARELWGIPKALGTFAPQAGAPFAAMLHAQARPVVAARFTPRLGLPGRWRIGGHTAQELRGRLHLARWQAAGRVQLGRAEWRFSPAGPLGFLAGRRPLASVRIRDLELAFGV